MNTNSNVSQLIATPGASTDAVSGAVTWWRLSAGLDLAALATAWEAEGLDKALLPRPPSEEVALRRACNVVCGPSQVVKGLEDGGLVIVALSENKERQKVEAGEVLRVKLNAVGRLEFPFVGDEDALDRLQEAYGEQQGTLNNGDVGTWLVKRVDECEAVGLRDTGGIYFVPKFALPRWEAIGRALRASSKAVLSSIPAMHAEDATASILDALSEEVAGTARRIQSEVEGGVLGSRALQTRARNAEEMLAKVGKYEGLFGTALEKLKDSLSTLRVEVSVAITEAEAAEEKARKEKARK